MLIWKVILSFIQNREYRELLYTSLLIICVGTIVFHYLEGWRWLDAVYFCVMTLTTIGYGDFSPVTDAGKIFNMVYVIIGLGLILGFINTVYSHYNTVKQIHHKRKDTH
jgi:voltage-gated potassium channel